MNNKVLDMAVVDELLSLSDGDDPELLLDLIQLFLDDGPAKVEAMSSGLDRGDFEQLERAAHALKGSSGNIGAAALHALCESMQLASRTHDLELSRVLGPQLAASFEQACAALRSLRAELAG